MIQVSQICDGRMTIYRAKGRLTFPEINAKIIDPGIEPIGSCILCDLTHATIADLTSDEIEQIISLISQRITRDGGRVAIIARHIVDYGLARMFGTFVEIAGLPINVRVFRIMEVAQEWLQETETAVNAIV